MLMMSQMIWDSVAQARRPAARLAGVSVAMVAAMVVVDIIMFTSYRVASQVGGSQ
jgi:hypothetical protein